MKKDLNKAQVSELSVDHPAHEFRYIWPTVGILERDDMNLLVMEGHRIIIPLKVRKTILDNIHRGNLGTSITWKHSQRRQCRK